MTKMPRRSDVDVITFGCRLNAVESEVMRTSASAAGLRDAVLINTCAVTNEAVRQARQTIRRTRRQRPGARIVVAGCAAQLDPAHFAEMPEVDQVLGNEEKLETAAYADFGLGETEKIRVNDIMSVEETAGHLIDGLDGRSRAFVQVQNGCDHRCTFCIIPYARGNSRSVPMGEVVRQIRHLVDNGYEEVVLTGVDITAYGADLPARPQLGDLCRRILANVPELPRLRLSSIDSVEVDEALFDLIAHEPRLMPHFHLSLQAGDDMILKRMKRRHSRDDSLRFCQQVRRLRPDAVFGADLIAGFPTETDEMFANTLALVDEADLTFLHVFPFSARPGTPAARMRQLLGDIRKARAAQLRAAGDAALQRFLQSQQGRSVRVLVEREEDGISFGHSEQFAPVRLEGAHKGIVDATVTGHDGESLLAV